MCNEHEETFLTGMNSQQDWDVQKFMDALFSTGKNLMNPSISDGTYKYVGIACTCDSSVGGGSICGFIFTDTYIGYDV